MTIQWAQGIDVLENTIPAQATNATPDVELAQAQPNKLGAKGGAIVAQPDTPDTTPIAPVDVLLTLAQMQDGFTDYQVQPPLSRIWAGDDPENPQWSVQLQFPDMDTAQSVLSGMWTTPPAQEP